jgi:RNA polymerase sigma-70 factor (ECF subfamily)
LAEEIRDLQDLEKVNLAKTGDLQAFDALVVQYQGMVSGLLFRFAGQRADLEDLVQETFIRAFKNLHRWQAHRPFSHWLKRIAVNVGRDHYRRKRRASKWFAESAPEEIERLESPCADSGRLSYTQEAQWFLAQLKPDDRTLLTLHYLNGMRFREIAEYLGWSLGKTKVRTLRAKRKLRQILEKHGYKFS